MWDGVRAQALRGLGSDGDDDGLPGPVLDGGAEGVLEHLGDDVLEMHGDGGEGGVGLAVDDDRGSGAVAELADVGDEAGAAVDYGGGLEGGVDDADEGGVLGAGGRAGLRVEVRLAAEVEGDVLLRDEAGADAGAQVLVEEGGDLGRGDVPPAFEEPASEDGGWCRCAWRRARPGCW